MTWTKRDGWIGGLITGRSLLYSLGCFHWMNLLEFSVKSGKHSIRTLSLVQNRMRFFKKPAKKYSRFQWGVKLRNAPFFCDKLSFILFWSPFFLSAYIFTAPTCTTTITTSNRVHQMINPDLIKLPYFADFAQTGDKGRWKDAQRQGEDRATLRKTLFFLYLFDLTMILIKSFFNCMVPPFLGARMGIK